MAELFQKIQEAKNSIEKQSRFKPDIAIILGTGLGKLAKEIKRAKKIPYSHIPHFPVPTGIGHEGELYLGKIHGKDVVCLAGRFHYYEGHSMEDITLPVRVVKALGAKTLIISNAAGGMNRNFKHGDIMLIEDHVNFMGVNPLIGPNDDRLGPRFPDMFEPYDKKLIHLAEKAAADLKIAIKKGVYVGVTGPNLETRAEYRMLSQLADVVGMSTVPEVIVAVHCGLRVLGLSIATDLCYPEVLKAANIDEIIKTANAAEPVLSKLVQEIISRM